MKAMGCRPTGMTLLMDTLYLWTYGESNPDLVHAMDAFYR